MTHEVADLEPTLQYLLQVSNHHDLWETRYILLLWLSLIIMIPFDLKIIDSAAAGQKSLVETVLEQGKMYLCVPGKESEGAAIMLSRLLTR
jgi:tubulin-specific chaperone D